MIGSPAGTASRPKRQRLSPPDSFFSISKELAGFSKGFSSRAAHSFAIWRASLLTSRKYMPGFWQCEQLAVILWWGMYDGQSPNERFWSTPSDNPHVGDCDITGSTTDQWVMAFPLTAHSLRPLTRTPSMDRTRPHGSELEICQSHACARRSTSAAIALAWGGYGG